MVDIWEAAERTRAVAGANTKAETEAVERARAWAEAEAKDKAEIARLHYRP